MNDDLVRKVNERVRDDRRCTISDLSLHFPQISRTLIYDIVSSHLGYRQPHSMRKVYKNLCPATIRASIMAANMWKNGLKNVESDHSFSSLSYDRSKASSKTSSPHSAI